MEYIRLCINGMWAVASLPLTIGQFELKLYYFPLFGILFGLVLKLAFGGGDR